MIGRGYFMVKIQRLWAMPDASTFSIKVIREFVFRYLQPGEVVVDPFARNCGFGYPYTNDLNPETEAQYHMDSVEFLKKIEGDGIRADLVLFDPPYSNRQVQEVYQSVGRSPTQRDSQNWMRWTDEREIIARILKPGGVVLSFGWNSNGMGEKRGFELEEILLVAHGSGHNDTICTAERKLIDSQERLFT